MHDSPKHERLATSITTVPNRRVNLLETILSDSSLIERLSQSNSVSLTLTLEVDAEGRARIEHGDVLDAAIPSKEAVRANEGFVPPRQMVCPGERPLPDTDYRLVGTLGSGGTGIVYQAHQRAIDREVAVKVLRDELAEDELSRKRFLQEARTLGSLDHPNVIALHELGTGPNGELFYSMKRVDGTSWDHSIDSMSQSENIDILMRVANAIRYAHSRGLIHRDIKPENVMIGPFGEVLVADWGLALSFSSKQQRVSDQQFHRRDSGLHGARVSGWRYRGSECSHRCLFARCGALSTPDRATLRTAARRCWSAYTPLRTMRYCQRS
jgi:serine/threonine protein kinase